MSSRNVGIFFSYASEDEPFYRALEQHLTIPKKQLRLDPWHNSVIGKAGQLSEQCIREDSIVVFLISAQFLASKQCIEIELPYALEEAERRTMSLIPVLVRPCVWNDLPLRTHQHLPSNGIAISEWPQIDAALYEVARGILNAVEAHMHAHADTVSPVLSSPIHWRVQPRQNPHFTDRQTTIAQLRSSFLASQTSRERIQALSGLGGIGKTQIALAYAYAYREQYRAVLWLRARTSNLLNEDIANLADPLGLSLEKDRSHWSHFTALQRWLRDREQWLVILDNLQDMQVIDQLIPAEVRGHVLITTNTDVINPWGHYVPVEPWNEEHGSDFLISRVTNSKKASKHEIVEIVRSCGGLPLALDQAGAYIEENRCSFADYLALFSQQRLALLLQRGAFPAEHPQSVAVTLTQCLDQAVQIHPTAIDILYLFAFLEITSIPDDLVLDGAKAFKGTLQKVATDLLQYHKALGALRRVSLVQQCDDPKLLSIHPLVRDILIGKLSEKQQRRWASQVVRLISAVFPEPSRQNLARCARSLSQAQHAAVLLDHYKLLFSEGVELFQRLGNYCCQIAMYEEAEQYLTRVLHWREQNRGKRHVQTAQTLYLLGAVYRERGEYQKAEQAFQRTLTICERVFGSNDVETMKSLDALGGIAVDQGEYARAENFYRRTLAIREQAYGPEHRLTIESLNNLGYLYDKRGDYVLAEQCHQRVFAIHERGGDVGTPTLIANLDHLALALQRQGKTQQAKTRYTRSLELCSETYGETHPQTARSLRNLADIARQQQDYEQAEVLYVRSLNLYKAVLNPKHPDIARCLNLLALVYQAQQRYSQAEALAAQALAWNEEMLGTEHPETARVLETLSGLSHELGNDEQAEHLLGRALHIYNRICGSEHPDTLRCLHHLADLAHSHQHHVLEQVLPQTPQPLQENTTQVTEHMSEDQI